MGFVLRSRHKLGLCLFVPKGAVPGQVYTQTQLGLQKGIPVWEWGCGRIRETSLWDNPEAVWGVFEYPVDATVSQDVTSNGLISSGFLVFLDSDKVLAADFIRNYAPLDRVTASFFQVVSSPTIAGYAGIAITGDGGKATAGNWGEAVAGVNGSAFAGNNGIAIVGAGGNAEAALWGRAFAGDGGKARVGDYGTAVAGHKGLAIAGDNGTARAGNMGIAEAGFDGTAIVGEGDGKDGGETYGGYAVVGAGGKAKAGVGAKFYIRGYKPVVVGFDGIKPDTFYRFVNKFLVEVPNT